MKRVIGVLGVMLVLWMGSEGFADLGDTDSDLVYTPVTPCRIIDTRVSGAGGPIPGNGTRDFVVVGATGFASQGGNPAGCGIPDNATSVMINFIAVNPPTTGHLRAWPYGGIMPNASIVNFVPGFNIANGLIQPICDAGVTTCTHDLSIYAASDVNVVADVMGYFRRFPIEGSGSIPALEARIAALEAKLDGLTRSGTDFVITNANLYIQSGSGATAEATNGKGNLIIGYNESRGEGMDIRTGSHNLIVGSEHNYNSSGGIVVGVKNTISSISASVTTSYNNTASGTYSSVSGGGGNTASGLYSSVTAGYGNTASGTYSSVSGGGSNTASGGRCSVSGGYNRSAPNDDDWAAGALWQDQ